MFPFVPDIGEIGVVAFDGVLDDGTSYSFPADTLTGLADDTSFAVFWDRIAEDYLAEPYPATTQFSDSDLVFIGWQSTPDTGGTYSPPPDAPPGYGGGGDPNYNIP